MCGIDLDSRICCRFEERGEARGSTTYQTWRLKEEEIPSADPALGRRIWAVGGLPVQDGGGGVVWLGWRVERKWGH